ncbi:MAG: RNA polymerase sigma factor [Gammaproteobacteria bacterium]|nr:RNA polymerase sigma factor [Gammaproteobacteria bacterium]
MDKFFSDQQKIIEQLLAGDNQAFKQVTRAWYSPMYYVASSIVGEAIADEVIQEAWTSVMRALPKFEGRSSLKSWVMRIVANEAKTRWRKESRSVSLEQIEESWSTDPRFDGSGHWVSRQSSFHQDSPEALMTAEALQDCIRKHISMLPSNQRQALMLKETESYSLDEICNILEVSSSNVRVLIHRARDKILQMIEHFEKEGSC